MKMVCNKTRIGIFPIFWGHARKESNMIFFTSQVETQQEKKKKPSINQLTRFCIFYRSFSAHSIKEKSHQESIKGKKTVSDQRESKTNQIQGNENKSSLDSHVVRKAAHEEPIQSGNMAKRGKDHWFKKKKGVWDQKKTKTNQIQHDRKESTLFSIKKRTPPVASQVNQAQVTKQVNQEQGAKQANPGQVTKQVKQEQGAKRANPGQVTKQVKQEQGAKRANPGQVTKQVKQEQGAKRANQGQVTKGTTQEEVTKQAKKRKLIEKSTYENQIKDENVQKKRKDKGCKEKKVVSTKKKTNNKAIRRFTFSTLAKNDRMGIKKKYGHRVKVFFGHAKIWLKKFLSKTWKRSSRKQRILYSTKKARLKKKLYRNITISKQLFTVGKKRIVTSKQLLGAKRVEYRKYKKRKRRPRKRRVFRIPPGEKVGLIALKGSYNNIILTLTDTDGNTKAWVSAGTAGFKNGQKSSHVAAEKAVEALVDKSVNIGYKMAKVKMKGMGGGKLKAIRRLCKGRLKLIGISDHFLIPHNGCRRARKPRN